MTSDSISMKSAWAKEALDYPLDSLNALDGKKVLITGASSGIGRGFSIAAARLGARVIMMARREDRLQEVASVISEIGGMAKIIVVDLGNRSDLKRAANDASQALNGGGPDVLINAAGINLRRSADEVSDDDWDKTLELNVSASFFLAQALVPAMTKKGWGRIVNIASLQSARAFPNSISYGTSKGAIVQLTRAMAEQWSAKGVLCNAVAPGFIPTELTERIAQDTAMVEALKQKTMIGRVGRVSDLFGPLSFLSSDASGYITGQTIFVDGGFTAK